MEVKLISIGAPTKHGSLASAEVQIVWDNSSTLNIADLNIIRNVQNGNLFIGFPNRVVGGRFIQSVSTSPRISKLIRDVLVAAYESWVKTQTQVQQVQQNAAQDVQNREVR
jgi:hypothetical protein